MRIGLCTPPEGLTAAVEGLEYIEPTVGNLMCPAEGEDKFAERRRAAEACALPSETVCCFIPGSLKTTGPDVDLAAVGAWVETACARAARLGVTRIVYGSGGSRRVPEGFSHADAAEQIVAHLKRWGPIAAPHDVVIVLEPLNLAECNIVNTVAEGTEYVRQANHPNIKMLVDTYHLAKDDESPESIVRAGDLVYHAHCADSNGRVPVGLGPEDHRPYFKALKQIGYAQRLSIEAKWEDLSAQLPEAVIKLRAQWEEA